MVLFPHYPVKVYTIEHRILVTHSLRTWLTISWALRYESLDFPLTKTRQHCTGHPSSSIQCLLPRVTSQTTFSQDKGSQWRRSTARSQLTCGGWCQSEPRGVRYWSPRLDFLSRNNLGYDSLNQVVFSHSLLSLEPLGIAKKTLVQCMNLKMCPLHSYKHILPTKSNFLELLTAGSKTHMAWDWLNLLWGGFTSEKHTKHPANCFAPSRCSTNESSWGAHHKHSGRVDFHEVSFK